MNHKNWILSLLLSAGFVLTILISTSHAALLKDIRVGEYSGFTRIVFELDAPAAPEKIEHLATGQLSVVFAGTSAGLIRKIPVERSPHLNNIQIWEQGDRLTALLAFDFDSFRQKSFSLLDPPRLVLDIHPTENAPNAGAESVPATRPDSESGFSPTASPRDSGPAAGVNGGDISGKSASRIQEPLPGDIHNPPLSASETVQTVPDDEAKKAPSALETDNIQQTPSVPRASAMADQSINTDQPPIIPPKPATRPSGARPSRLQFYLVIFLVSITIAILVLLLLMLLVRNRWIEDRSRQIAREDPESPQKS